MAGAFFMKYKINKIKKNAISTFFVTLTLVSVNTKSTGIVFFLIWMRSWGIAIFISTVFSVIIFDWLRLLNQNKPLFRTVLLWLKRIR
jgi:hypothetical protein